ncbi:hypothetical protein CEE34_11000 [Candidatus Aerophobetes bacterium Ae_b3a]|nr:MAG: hypothetical protein CEE34_11000 [Candidatus Aerophobetes bacterium Ae_b3a]
MPKEHGVCRNELKEEYPGEVAVLLENGLGRILRGILKNIEGDIDGNIQEKELSPYNTQHLFTFAKKRGPTTSYSQVFGL